MNKFSICPPRTCCAFQTFIFPCPLHGPQSKPIHILSGLLWVHQSFVDSVGDNGNCTNSKKLWQDYVSKAWHFVISAHWKLCLLLLLSIFLIGGFGFSVQCFDSLKTMRLFIVRSLCRVVKGADSCRMGGGSRLGGWQFRTPSTGFLPIVKVYEVEENVGISSFCHHIILSSHSAQTRSNHTSES